MNTTKRPLRTSKYPANACLLRCDFNVPQDDAGNITCRQAHRVESLPTITAIW